MSKTKLDSRIDRKLIFDDIWNERNRQDEIWGPQDHTLPEWLAILIEEVGELAAAILGHHFGNEDHIELYWRKEATQVAAVAVSILEQYEKQPNDQVVHDPKTGKEEEK